MFAWNLIPAWNKLPITQPEKPTALDLERHTGTLHRSGFHPALRDFGLMGSTSFLVSITTMAVIAVVGRTRPAALLGEYLLIRRMASWLQGGVQLPSGVALPRYVASAVNEPHSTKQAYFLAALLTSCGTALLICIALILGRNPLSRIFFGTQQLAPLVFPLGLLLLGLAVHGAVFGYYQGTVEMERACGLQWCNLIVVPILAIVLSERSGSIALLVDLMGIFMIVGSFFFALPIARNFELRGLLGILKKPTFELFSFGLPRVWGDFGVQALLSAPAVIAAHFLPIASVAFLLLGGTFLTAVAAATLPLAIILLSRISRSIAQGRAAQLRMQVTYFASALIDFSAFIALQALVFSDVIVKIWVGPKYLEGIVVIQIAIIGMPFYFVYAGLRSVIDAAAVKAYNTRNILVSLAFLLFLAGIVTNLRREHLLEGLAASSVFALIVLTYKTLRTTFQLFEIDRRQVEIIRGLTIAAILGAVSFSLHHWLRFEPGLFTLLFFEVIATLVYFALLHLLGSHWSQFVLELTFKGLSSKHRSPNSATS